MQAQRDIVSVIVEYFGRRKGAPNRNFTETKLIDMPHDPIKIRLNCAYLRIPAGAAALLISPDNELIEYEKGGMLYLQSGNYKVVYVDLRQRTTTLHRVSGVTKDGLNVLLAVQITWRVIDATEVYNIQEPSRVAALKKHCEAAVKNFVRGTTHSIFAASPDGEPVEEEVIENGILNILRRNSAISGYDFIGVNLLLREGDKEISSSIRGAIRQKTQIEKETVVELQVMKGQLELIKQGIALAQQRQELVKEKTEISQREAVVMAETKAKVADILNKYQREQIELQQFAKSQDMKQEQKLAMIEAMKDVLSDMAGVISQAQLTPGLQNSLDQNQLDAMKEIAFSFSSFINEESKGDGFGNDDDFDDMDDILPVIDLD